MSRAGEFHGHRSLNKPDGSTKDSWERFLCSYCGNITSGAVVARTRDTHRIGVVWLQCPECANGSVKDPDGTVHPASKFGPKIGGLPERVEEAYEEVRECMSVAAYRACELLCRNLLMYVAVDHGADEGESFVNYIDYLAEQGFVTPPMEDWVDQIRKIGNKRAHELDPPDKSRAESTVMFTAELLRLIYEMESLGERYAGDSDVDATGE